MIRFLRFALAASLIVSATTLPSLADDDHAHGKGNDYAEHKNDEAGHRAKHGGEFIETTGHHGVEMVLSGTSLVFHMTSDHDPLKVTGASFKATIQTDAGTRLIPLKAEGTTLSATLDAVLPKGAKIAVSGKDPRGKVVQARFVIK